jgi:pentatricopeptide repeat protein
MADITQAGIDPNVWTFSIMLKSCAVSGDLNSARRLWETMQYLAVQVDVNCAESLIPMLAGARDNEFEIREANGAGSEWKRAFNKIVEGQGVKPTVRLINNTMRALNARGQGGGGEDMIKLFADMTRYSLEPTCGTFEPLIELFCHKSEMHRVHVLFQELRRRGIRPSPNVYNSILRASGKLGCDSPLLM